MGCFVRIFTHKTQVCAYFTFNLQSLQVYLLQHNQTQWDAMSHNGASVMKLRSH